MDRYIRDDVITDRPPHRSQFAHHPGIPKETALQNVTKKNKNATAHKETALKAILDTEGAFDRTSFAAAERHREGSATVRWTNTVLESRHVIATRRQQLGVSRRGKCALCLLCSLAVNELFGKLNKGSYYATGYADNTAVL